MRRAIDTIAVMIPVASSGTPRSSRDHDLREPDDLSVTGFDDIPAAGPAGLTTVWQPATEKGCAAWSLLERESRDHVLIPHELIVRSTTSAPILSP
jgi:DNA-binding LacI/PurR family transcriptional regulator